MIKPINAINHKGFNLKSNDKNKNISVNIKSTSKINNGTFQAMLDNELKKK